MTDVFGKRLFRCWKIAKDVAKEETLLRTVSLFATAHTFCASRNGPRKSGFLRTVSAKTDLGKGYWDLN